MTGHGDLSTVLGGIGDEAAPDLAGQISVHRELGWRQLELRTVDGVALAELSAGRRAAVADAVARAELSVPCLDSRIGGWARPITFPFERELAELDVLIDFAARTGTRYVRVMSYPNDGLPERDWYEEVLRRLRTLAERAAAAGIVLLHENCVGWAGTAAERIVALIDAVGAESLRVLFDLGNPVAYGYDGRAYLDAVLPYVEHVHVKDARPADLPDETEFTRIGDGVAHVAECIDVLLRYGYRGVFCAEPHISVVPHLGKRARQAECRAEYLSYGADLRRLLGRLADPVAGGAP
jgi:L-ribulose-5-phosphate 3-epimerase